MLTDTAVFRKSITALPLKIYRAGETVLAAGYTTGQLLILRKGSVSVAKEGIEIARVTDPGAVFGELSALLDQPHSADVRALHPRTFTRPTRPRCFKTQPCSCMLQQFWHGDLTALIKRSLS